MNHLFSVVSLFALLVVASACGNSETPDGFCPSDVLDRDGACIAITCATGTVLADGVCVPDEGALCGPDTIWVNGQCRPANSPVVCGEGTSLTQDGLRCISDVVCGPGTILMDKECLSEDEVVVVVTDADESISENDPAFGGTPQTIELKGMGDPYLLKGQIATPEDKDGSGKLDQDMDVYEFSGENAEYVRIHVIPLGQGSFGFEVNGPQGYYRQGPRHEAAPVRSLLLPADGDYQIRVQPQATLFQTDAGPVGGDEYGYLLILENLGSLDPDQGSVLDLNSNQNFVGNFQQPEKNLIKLVFPNQTYGRLTLESVGSSIQPALLLLDNAGRVLEQLPTGQTSFLVNGAVADSRWVYLDTISNTGLNDAVQLRGDSLSTLRFPSSLRGGESVSRVTSDSVQPLQQRFFAIDIELVTAEGMATPQGLVVQFRLDKPAFIPSILRAYSPNGAIASEQAGNSVVFYAGESGTYLVEFANEDGDNNLPFADVYVYANVPVDLSTLNTTTDTSRTAPYVVAADSQTYFTFRTTEAATVAVTPSGGSLPAGVTLYGVDMETRVATQSPNVAIQRHVVAAAERRIGALINTGTTSLSGQITVSASAAPSWAAPNNTMVAADPMSPGDSRLARIAPQGQNYYVIETGQKQGLELRADTEGFRSLLIELLDNDGNPIERGRSTNTGFSVGAVFQPNQSYFLKVTNTDTESLVYAVFADSLTLNATLEAEPNQQADEATQVPWVALSKTLDMAGTVTGFGDDDWFEFNLTQPRWFDMEFLPLNGFSPTQNAMRVTFYAADGTTELPSVGSVLLPAGKSYARVTSPLFAFTGNSYHLRLTAPDYESLGTLASSGEVNRRTGVFVAGGLREGFSFTLDSTLPAGEAIVAWSNATITVFDQTGVPLHVSADSGQFFGTAKDPSFFGAGLPAGTYFITIESDIPDAWELFVGRMTQVNENELPGTNTSDSYETAENLGTLVAGTPIYRFGTVSFSDTVDYFTFTVPPSAQPARRVVIEQFQLGESVADLDLALHDSMDIPLANSLFTPQVIDVNLEPNTYAALSRFFSDVGFNSGAYLLRITMF